MQKKSSTKGKGARRKPAPQPAPFSVADQLRDFGFRAYSAALGFYARHHADAGALEAYTTAARLGFDVPADRDSNAALAHHISEAIRIAGERADLPASLFNDLGNAGSDFLNDLPSLAAFNDSEPCILARARSLRRADERAEGRREELSKAVLEISMSSGVMVDHPALARRAFLAKPEPKKKTSAEWRYWKLCQIEHAFENRTDARDLYRQAWEYVKELFKGLLLCPDFWHVDLITPLLPHLIIARQEIDEIYAHEKRTRAGVKGAKKRKARKGAEEK
jgi:hypothetical protein